MKYKIVVDSCCDLTEDMKKWKDFSVVPLTLQLGDYKIFDDENFDQDDFISKMVAFDGIAKSACPSPDAFAKACEGDYDAVFMLTITDKLSGCYNSACQGKMLYEEEHNDNKKIYVFNSFATSGLETLVAIKIKEVADSGSDFDTVVKEVEKYCVDECGLYFCLESLDALKGNGRLYNLAAKVIETLRVKLVLRRTKIGNIEIAGKDFSSSRALAKIATKINEDTQGCDLSQKTCIVTYVCCKEKADDLVNKIKGTCSFSNVFALKCSGLNSLYASNGGIIVSYDK